MQEEAASGWGWPRDPSGLGPVVDFGGRREDLPSLHSALGPSVFQGLARVLHVEPGTEDYSVGRSRPAQALLSLAFLALEGRLHHANQSSVASFSISNLLNANSCSLRRDLA